MSDFQTNNKALREKTAQERKEKREKLNARLAKKKQAMKAKHKETLNAVMFGALEGERSSDS